MQLREGAYYERVNGEVVGPCVRNEQRNAWMIGCVIYDDFGTTDLGEVFCLAREVEKPTDEDCVFVSWGSYRMGFKGCTMEQAVEKFAERVPLTDKVVVVAQYSWNTEQVWQLTVEPETIYHVGQLRGIE